MATYPKNFSEGLLFVYIGLVITALTPLIRIFKLPELLKFLSPNQAILKRWQVDKVVDFTDTILGQESFIYRPNCFKRTLSLYYFLSRTGLPVQVNLGVRKKEEKLEGHGWLTLHGQPYKEPNPNSLNYQVVYYYPQTI